MRVALSFWFDAALEEQIRLLSGRLQSGGVPSLLSYPQFRPHLTTGLWHIDTLEPLRSALQKELAAQKPVPVRFESVGVFPGADCPVFFAPIVAAPLLNLHQRICDTAAGCATTASPYYRPGLWVPHCTLALQITPSEMLEAVRMMRDWLPLEGYINRLGFIETEVETELDAIAFAEESQ